MRRWITARVELLLVSIVIALVCAQPHATEMALRRGSVNEQLMTATNTGDHEAFAQALRHGADLSARDRSGSTALTSAAMAGRADMVRRLLDLGADPNATNARGATPLMYAVSSDHFAAARLLLEHGADPAIACHGLTALDWARLAESEQCVDLLVGWEAK